MGRPPRPDVEALLARSDWIRRVARALVGDDSAFEDVAQEAWVAALRQPPSSGGESADGWFVKVMRNAYLMMRRSEARRARRESSVASADEAPSTDDLFERAELHRVLASLIVGLDEPVRAVVLLHYYEGLSSAEIARRQGVPAGTVRWRLKQGVDQLRRGLDAAYGGRRSRWVRGLMPLAGAWQEPSGTVPWKGVLVMKGTGKAVVAAVLVLAALVVFWRGGRRAPVSGAGASEAQATNRSRAPEVARAEAGRAVVEGTVRVAGRVIADGKPVARAAVRLVDTRVGVELAPAAWADEGGTFQLDVRGADRGTLVATSPGFEPGIVAVDLSDPRARTRLEVTLQACEAVLFGVVRDAAEGPVAGAQVHLVGEPVDMRSPVVSARVTPPVAESDSSGRYEVCVPPGHLGVAVEAAAYGGTVTWLDVRGRYRHDVALSPGAVLSGRVVNDGQPVRHAVVEVGAASPGLLQPFPRRTTTDVDGRFHLEGVAAGRQRVSATASGMALVAPVEVQVVPGVSSAVTLRMQGAARLDGRLTDGRAPVGGATIVAVLEGLGRRSAEAVTAADGTFELARVPRGPVTFLVEGRAAERPARVDVDREVVQGVEVVVSGWGELRGTVTSNGATVARAEVSVEGPALRRNLRTDGRGRFHLRWLRPGTYSIRASSVQAGASSEAATVTVAAGGVADVSVALARVAAISGVVVDRAQRPVGGAAVRIVADDGGEEAWAQAEEDGAFHATGLVGGRQYRFEVRDAYGFALSGAHPALALRPGERATGVRLVVRVERLAISGRVVDGAGAPQSDVRVRTVPDRDGAQPYVGNWAVFPTAVTTPSGAFEIRDVPRGRFALHAQGADGSEAVARAIASGQRGVRIVLEQPGGIEGELIGFQTTPDVWVLRSGVLYLPPIHAEATDQTFRVRGLAPGRYQVSTAAPAEGDLTVVDVRAGETARAVLRSRGGATVSGRIVDFKTGQGVKGMHCHAWLQNGPYRAVQFLPGEQWSDDDGRFVLPVPAGLVGVTCWGNGEPYSDGIVALAANQGGTTKVTVPVVRRTRAVPSSIGASVDWSLRTAKLAAVEDSGPAARAGLRPGDVIVAVDGTPVDRLSLSGVWTLVLDRDPGERVSLIVSRDGQTVAADVTVDKGG